MKYLKYMTLCLVLVSATANAKTAAEIEKMEKALSVIEEFIKSDAFKKASPETKASAEAYLASNREFHENKKALQESQREQQIFRDAILAMNSGSQSVTSNMNRLAIEEVKRHVPGLTTDKAVVKWMDEHKAETKKMMMDAQSNKDSAIVQSLAKQGAAMRKASGKAL